VYFSIRVRILTHTPGRDSTMATNAKIISHHMNGYLSDFDLVGRETALAVFSLGYKCSRALIEKYPLLGCKL
jgi:hypothetical protein